MQTGPVSENSIHQVFKNDNFQALGLDVWNGSAAQVTTFQAQTGITYPLCLQASNVQSDYGVIRDYSAVVDQQGILRYKGSGVNPSQIVSVIMNLLSTTAIDPSSEIPNNFVLEQNYPNPFNPTTRIKFSIPNSEHVSIKIYTADGKFIKTLLDNEMNAGDHALSWNGLTENGEPAASGIYFYRMIAGKFTESRKMILLQ